MSYRIGSFNVHNLSLTSGHDLDRIAAIINDNQLDIVSLQEVLSGGKALTGIGLSDPAGQMKAYEYSLKRRLRGNWRACWRDPQTRAKDYPYLGDDKRDEGYAFLWNTDKIELPVNSSGQEIYPQIWHQYKHKSQGLYRLIRDPLCGRFKIKGLRAELRLISTHIVYGKPKPENFGADLDRSALQMRRNEFRLLAGYIYPRIAEYCKEAFCTVPYTIILGDYNLNLRESGIGKALLPSIIHFDRNGFEHDIPDELTYTIHNVQAEKTTINKDKTDFANNYDHFSYDDRTQDIVAHVARIDAVHQYAQAENSADECFKQYYEKVSDHVPIVIEIDFR